MRIWTYLFRFLITEDDIVAGCIDHLGQCVLARAVTRIISTHISPRMPSATCIGEHKRLITRLNEFPKKYFSCN